MVPAEGSEWSTAYGTKHTMPVEDLQSPVTSGITGGLRSMRSRVGGRSRQTPQTLWW
jgi:hypothetical protein